MGLNITSYQAKYLANALTRRLPANDTANLTHRLRNVYKPTNMISNIIKDALESRKKIIMTKRWSKQSCLTLNGIYNNERYICPRCSRSWL